MKYADAESIGLATNDKHTAQLAWAYMRALESLFQIATGTSSAEGTARHCLRQLGLFGGDTNPAAHAWRENPAHSTNMGFLTGYSRDDAASILRSETQTPRPCPHADGSCRVPTPAPTNAPVRSVANIAEHATSGTSADVPGTTSPTP